ncbi:MAG: precorrin-3B C(17)-methyltransferase [Syntrophothermus sp.]|uniref:precorrin-3B C(17)-methyltransferase n=1 Tax=Syntrophothermus sp. TaxID=2736299 RepID=UPI00257B0972|nr:precorrin-3B C(17)-methyltransferase [Syntrophothermus sp.]NSW82373.1 precorrin-3B C(17)-methyltransferase [Syntrophothermus sp.]
MKKQGEILVVGLGSGSEDSLTQEARQAIEESDVIIGYKTYTALIANVTAGKKVISSGMRKEVDRCHQALDLAEAGYKVALVSSGDPGIYGMAGIMLEVAQKRNRHIPIRVVPGVTAASIAAAVLGAPLMHDFAVISLSDLLTPWEKIRLRLELCAQADLIICLYNPRSHGRTQQLTEAWQILSKYKKPETPVGIVKNAGRPDQKADLTDLGSMLSVETGMSSVIIIGNQSTYIADGKMITPRGYVL